MKFDRYAHVAQMLPVYLTAAPIVLALAATLPEGLNLPIAGASALVFAPLSYLFTQISGDLGSRLEPALWNSWGGPPTIRFLCHDNEEYLPDTRTRLHSHLRTLGLEIPTADEERADRSRALELYGSAADELRRRTRDESQFPLVAKGNTQYGFRRNLLGLKPAGLAITALVFAASSGMLLHGWNTLGVVLPVPVVSTLLVASIGVGWLFGVRPEAVRITGDRYARYLLEAAHNLEPPNEPREIVLRG